MTYPSPYEIRERVAGANGKIAQYGMLLAKVEWGTTPLRTWVWKMSSMTDMNRDARERHVMGDMLLHHSDIMVEEPHPDAFPSDAWAMRVLGVA